MNTARWSDDPRETASAPAEPGTPAAEDIVATRSTLRGLIWLGILALVFAVSRAGLGRAFIAHWWAKW